MAMTTNELLRSHWDCLRSDGDIPSRSDIDPREITDALDSLFILERLNPQDVRVRIAGLTLCEMIGMEVRGQSPTTFFGEKTSARFKAVLDDVMGRPTIAHLGLDAADKIGNLSRVEMVLLPLRSDFGDVSRIIGCVTPPPNGFTAPVRLNIRTVDMEAITETAPCEQSESFGFAENRSGFILDGTSAFRSITGAGAARVRRQPAKPGYLKVVD